MPACGFVDVDIKRKLASKCLAKLSICASAMLVPAHSALGYVWDEKWPVATPINDTNFVSEFLRATFGEMGYKAAGKLDAILNDPNAQIKVAAQLVPYLSEFYQRPGISSDMKSQEYLMMIEEDFNGHSSGSIPNQFSPIAQYAPRFGVAKLVWPRVLSTFNCQIMKNGQLSTEQWNVEAEYSVYRNGKRILAFSERVARGVPPGTYVNVSWGAASGLSFKNVPGSLPDPTTQAGPFYDFDPYNFPVGQAVSYEVQAQIRGCDSSTMAPGLGAMARIGRVTLDMDGDGRPEFYPSREFNEKRANKVTVGAWSGSMTDASGRVEVALFKRRVALAVSTTKDFEIGVPEGYIAIGGGLSPGVGKSDGGYLVTASYPKTDLTGWLVSAKDHRVIDPQSVTGYVLGLRISGISRADLMKEIVVSEATSASSSRPEAVATLPAGYEMLGGGIRVNWNGYGLLATASFPETLASWRVKAKDHTYAEVASATAYIVGIKKAIPGIGVVSSDVRSSRGAMAAHPSISVDLPSGYMLTGCGVNVNWSGAGNLVKEINPNPQARRCSVASKDHYHSSPATIDGYALGISISP